MTIGILTDDADSRRAIEIQHNHRCTIEVADNGWLVTTRTWTGANGGHWRKRRVVCTTIHQVLAMVNESVGVVR